MTIAAVLLCALLLYGLCEGKRHRDVVSDIPIRILVNGTRGKTSVSRLTAAALNQAGIRTWAKTTGSQARYIAPDGKEIDYRSSRAANLLEQLAFFRTAHADGAQAVVVECMAIADENQRLMAHHLVRPTHVLLTNALVDHVEEIGDSVEITARTLAMSVPKTAHVFVASDDFGAVLPQAQKAGPFLDGAYLEALPFPTPADNVSLVLALTDALGIPRATALSGMRLAQADAGMAGPFQIGKCTVINAFAVNDVPSFQNVLANLRKEERVMYALFNHRVDRMYRLPIFADALAQSGVPFRAIGVTGDQPKFAARTFARRTRIPALPVPEPKEWLRTIAQEDCVLLCFGNIKGQGLYLINFLREGNHA